MTTSESKASQAKSFHQIIMEGRFDVVHRGQTLELELPSWLSEIGTDTDSLERLDEWRSELPADSQLALYHYAIKEILIALRAKARPAKGTKTTPEKPFEPATAQERINSFELRSIAKPGTSSSSLKAKAEAEALAKMIKAMQAAGLSDEQIALVAQQASGA